MSTATETLPDNATHEQIEAYLDKVVAPAPVDEPSEAEGASEATPVEKPAVDLAKSPEPAAKPAKPRAPRKPKGAAPKAPSPKTIEPPVDDEIPASGSAAQSGGDESAEEEIPGQSWLDDAFVAEAAALGISEDELQGFTSREEADRALTLFDRAAMKAGRAVQAGAQGEPPPSAPAKPVVPAAQTPTPPKAPAQSSAQTGDPWEDLTPFKLDDQLGADDAPVISRFIETTAATIRDLRSRLDRYENGERARQVQAVERQFDSFVDSLDMPELFGESGKLTKEAFETRKQLFLASDAYLRGLNSQGRQAQLSKSLVERAARVEFADHFSKQQRKQLTRKITKQSGLRMNVGSGRATDKAPDLEDQMQQLYNELERQ